MKFQDLWRIGRSRITSRTLAHALVCCLSLGLAAVLPQATDAVPPQPVERILIANDTCPDVTWGWTEEQTRQALAELVRSHLDEMQRTEDNPRESRDHFNMATTQEALDFVARCPARKEELIRRIREGRVCVSPFLCNSLWGFQSVEGTLRTLYPARRLEREWNIPLDVAEHIELPSLPWGMASLLAGCGVRWVSNPFYDYDCTFKALRNPPLFRWTGPDGNELRVIMDAWACSRANYAQGARLLNEPARIVNEWLPHYRELGRAYPVPSILASGTHSDTSPESWKQTRGFSEALRRYNAAGTNPVRLVNGTLAQFCAEVDRIEGNSPFLPVLRGCFGHSWELWPVSLARTVAGLRANERNFVAAESLVALATLEDRSFAGITRTNREQAEWYWAMLSDHAWNGTDLKNKRHNAELRQRWAEGLGDISRDLTQQAWKSLGLRDDERFITVFNPLSFTNDVLVVCDAPPQVQGVAGFGKAIPAQFLEGGTGRRVTFVAREIPPFGFREFVFTRKPPAPKSVLLKASASQIEGRCYRLGLAGDGAGIASLVHKDTGQELVASDGKRLLGQAVFFDGTEHKLERTTVAVAASGPVFASLRITGVLGPMHVTNDIVLYAELDRVDIDAQLEKPPTTNEQRLLHFFPLGGAPGDCHIETTGAVICPSPQPEGDLLPGADTRRFAVQGFLDVSPAHARAGVTVSPMDAFMLRLDQGVPAFEALGNDQNWKEVTQDQDGVSQFRFRYSLRAHPSGYNNAAAMAWSRSVQAPLVYARGRLPGRWLDRPLVYIDPNRALVTCLKPVDDPQATGLLVRLWETAGLPEPVRLLIPHARRAMETDLLERPQGPHYPVRSGMDLVPRPHGFMALRWER